MPRGETGVAMNRQPAFATASYQLILGKRRT